MSTPLQVNIRFLRMNQKEDELDGSIWKMRCRGLNSLLYGRDYLVFEDAKFFSKHLKEAHGYEVAAYETVRTKKGMAWSTTLTSTQGLSDVIWMGVYVYGQDRIEGTYTWTVGGQQKVRSFVAKRVRQK